MLSLAFFIDSAKEMGTNDVHLSQAASNKAQIQFKTDLNNSQLKALD